MLTARCRRNRPPQGYFLQLQRRTISDFYEESEEEDAYCDDPNDDDVELYVPEGMHEISRIVGLDLDEGPLLYILLCL